MSFTRSSFLPFTFALLSTTQYAVAARNLNENSVIERIEVNMATQTKTIESCKNPWKRKCENEDVAVYIYYRYRLLPICRDCWSTIADDDIEW